MRTSQQNQAPYAGQPNEMQNVAGNNKSMSEGAGINASGDAYNHPVNPGYNSQTPNTGFSQSSNMPNNGAYSQPENMHNQPMHNQPLDMPHHTTYQPPNVQSNPPNYVSTGA